MKTIYIEFKGPKKSAISQAAIRNIPFEFMYESKGVDSKSLTVGRVSYDYLFKVNKWLKTGEVRVIDIESNPKLRSKKNPVKKSRKRKFKKIIHALKRKIKKVIKNPKVKKETLFFIYAKRGGMAGLFNRERNSLTTDKADATHYHNKESAKAAVESLRKSFPKWKWSVKPITFFESK